MWREKKRYIRGGFALLVLLSALLLPRSGVRAYQANPLDEILRYDIRLTVNEDGSARIHYDLNWKVLDDDRDGPLTWVKIGIGNRHIKDLEAESSTIKKIRYMREKGGDYARIDLDRRYYAGEIVHFSFALTQYNIFQKDPDNQQVVYSFTPGWFDDTPVDEMNLYWGTDKARKTEGFLQTDDGQSVRTVTIGDQSYYHAKKTDLGQGERMTVSVSYPPNAYSFVDGRNIGPNDSLATYLVLAVLAGPLLVFGLIRFHGRGKSLEDTYNATEGGARPYHGRWIHRGGGGCACACACACAGGGRAGCSRKDFYGTKLSAMELRKALRQLAREDGEQELTATSAGRSEKLRREKTE